MRGTILIAAWMTGIGLAAASDRADTLAEASAKGQGEIRVLYVASPGWAGQDADGEPTGLTVEIMRRFVAWAERENGLALSIDWVEEDDWSRFYGRVRDARGGVFGLGNVTITEQRRQELAFSPPYVNNVAVLISHADVPEATSPEALVEAFSDLRAMAFSGTLHQARLERLARAHWPEMPMDVTGSNDAIVAAAAAGTHFGYIDGYHFFRERAQGQPLRHHPAFADPGETFGIIMPHASDWQPLMQAFFEADSGLVNSAWYRQRLEYHLGAEVAELLAGGPDGPES